MERFEMTLTAAGERTATLCCGEILRRIAGRRTVFSGTYEGRAVIVKRFEDFFGGYRCRREKRGLERLEGCGLAAPKVLLAGQDRAGHAVLVIEMIEGATDGDSAVQEASSETAAKAILSEVFRYIGRMHQAGVVQKDMHLGNFLVAGSSVWAIDPARMRFGSDPVSLDAGFRQVAMLTAGLPQQYLDCDAEFLEVYCGERGVALAPAMVDKLRQLTTLRREAYMSVALKKTLRDSKGFFVLRRPPYRGVFGKEVFDAESAGRLIETLGEMTNCDEKDIFLCFDEQQYQVICFYPHSRLEALMRRAAGSGGRRAWLAGWRAFYTGRSRCHPAALIEFRAGLFAGASWVVGKDSFEKDV